MALSAEVKRWQFMYLPVDVFRRSTNIETLVMKELRNASKTSSKLPPQKLTTETIENYHRQLQLGEENALFSRLDYNWPHTEAKMYVKVLSASLAVYLSSILCQIFISLFFLEKLPFGLYRRRNSTESIVLRLIVKNSSFSCHSIFSVTKRMSTIW